MFGTNYPMITPEKCIQDLENLKLDHETESLFLYKNAQQVFNIS